MTIGAYGYDPSNGPNPDFLTLKKCQENVSNELGFDVNNIELSMGMSTDYEHAVSVIIKIIFFYFIIFNYINYYFYINRLNWAVQMFVLEVQYSVKDPQKLCK